MSPASPVLGALSRAAGLELRSYRESHVEQCIRRAIERERVASAAELPSRLDADQTARERFRRSVAISVSGMFRDPGQFELLERELLPPLLAGERTLRVWSAGCADGSELISVALMLDRVGALARARLLGSDLLEENLQAARAAAARTAPAGAHARMLWDRRDLVRDGAPGGSWSLVLCRNVAIYLAPESRERLHRTLAEALAPSGILLLGRSERILRPRELGLTPAGPHAYRRAA